MNFIKGSLILFLLLGFQTCFSQNDCVSAIVTCGNSRFNNLAVQGAGIEEINGSNSCGGFEFNTVWIKVVIKNSGTMGFTITPEDTDITVDFDFYIFGPDVPCGSLGNAIRCSATNPQAAGSVDNLTGMNSSETDVSEGPGADGNNYVQWLDVIAGETYFIAIDRAVGNGNFSLDWTGTATFSDPPTINDLTTGALNLALCDGDAIQDDSTEFDLTVTGITAIGSQANVIAGYYLNENDALTGLNQIPNATTFPNTSNPQTIYIRLENGISNCFDIAPFTLTVTPFNVPDIIDLSECDQDNDGFVVFDLTQIRNLLNADPNNTITFHDTNPGTVNLPDNYTNQTAFTNEVLWVQVHNTVTGCTAYKSFNITINSTPVVVPSQLTQCDFELFPDGLTTFNLTQANATITNGDATLLTEFYLNATDAQNSLREQNTTFDNTTNPQTLTVKVINPTTSCYSLTQLTLNVSVNPTTTVIVENCDDLPEDSTTTFDLADGGFEIGGNIVTYYNNANDALLEQNPIVTNPISSQGQDVYARVENINDCVGIHIIRLVVAPLPQLTVDVDGVLCANQNTRTVTLSTQISNPANFTFSWAPNGETTQNITVTQPGDYTVTVTNAATSCTKDVTTHIEASEAPILGGIDVVDLVQANSITVNVSGNGDYWYSLDDGIFQQSNFFDHVYPGEHIVTIEDRNGCGVAYQTVFVLGVPAYFTPNGDGYQDHWQVMGIDVNTNLTTKILIFNRYGKLLKQISSLGDGWDGTFNGHLLPGDDYWYSIQFQNGKSAKGHFSLKR